MDFKTGIDCSIQVTFCSDNHKVLKIYQYLMKKQILIHFDANK